MPDDRFTGSFIVVFRRPHAPIALGYLGTRIRWTPHKVSQEVKSYVLYRKTRMGWGKVKETPAARGQCQVMTPGAYMMTSLEWSGLESDVSSPTIVIPSGRRGPAVKEWDKSAPAAPSGFAATREAPGQFRLKWLPPLEKDVRHFNVYFSKRGKPEAIQKRRFASPPLGTTQYLDWTAPKDGDANYAITAVDRQGNESKPAFASAANE
jgi:hypothetical protein